MGVVWAEFGSTSNTLICYITKIHYFRDWGGGGGGGGGRALAERAWGECFTPAYVHCTCTLFTCTCLHSILHTMYYISISHSILETGWTTNLKANLIKCSLISLSTQFGFVLVEFLIHICIATYVLELCTVG